MKPDYIWEGPCRLERFCEDNASVSSAMIDAANYLSSIM